jgi:hypothetical protein
MKPMLLPTHAKERREFETWRHVEDELGRADSGEDSTQVWIALQMVLSLERIEFQTRQESDG